MAAKPEALLARLDTIGLVLAASGNARALLALGSVGLETSRLDAYSDLDFFAVMKDGFKQTYINSLDWLCQAYPIVFSYRNTVDGHKVLFDDGIFAEFAVFEVGDLAHIPFVEGRLVWHEPDFDPALALPPWGKHPPEPTSPEWLAGEVLSCLYVGMSRLRRGETLAAFQMIQGFAVENLLKLAAQQQTSTDAMSDRFNITRRFEQIYPNTAPLLPTLMQGYNHSAESAQAVLAMLETLHPVNAAMKASILHLCNEK